MNKADLIEAVAGVTSTKKEAAAAVDCVLTTITKALKKKQDVTLVGFGTFSVKKRKARSGRNPQTGEPITLSSRKVVTFKYSGKLRHFVNGDS